MLFLTMLRILILLFFVWVFVRIIFLGHRRKSFYSNRERKAGQRGSGRKYVDSKVVSEDKQEGEQG